MALVVLEARRSMVDEPLVLQALLDDDVPHRVGQGDIGAHPDGQPIVRRLDREGAARIDHHHARAVVDAFEHVQEHHRVRLARVRAPEQDHVGMLHLLVGAGAAAAAEHRRQTGDAGSVSSAVAAIDVVTRQHRAHELLRHEVHLVGGLRAAEEAEGGRRRAGLDLAKRVATRSSASSQLAGCSRRSCGSGASSAARYGRFSSPVIIDVPPAHTIQ